MKILHRNQMKAFNLTLLKTSTKTKQYYESNFSVDICMDIRNISFQNGDLIGMKTKLISKTLMLTKFSRSFRHALLLSAGSNKNLVIQFTHNHFTRSMILKYHKTALSLATNASLHTILLQSNGGYKTANVVIQIRKTRLQTEHGSIFMNHVK